MLAASIVTRKIFISASAAAVNGGVTHVADMPNNPVPPIDEKKLR
jgi:dihydroorotase